MFSDKVSAVRYMSPTFDGVVAASSKDVIQAGNRMLPRKAGGAMPMQDIVSTRKGTVSSDVYSFSEQVREATGRVRHYIRQFASELDFSVDEDTEKIVVQLLDKSTGEILRQVPTEEILHVAKMLDKLQGLLYNDHA